MLLDEVSHVRFIGLLAGAVSASQPLFQRTLGFSEAAAIQQTLHADVFIELRPMNPLPLANQTRVLTFRRRRVRQARVPREGWPSVWCEHGLGRRQLQFVLALAFHEGKGQVHSIRMLDGFTARRSSRSRRLQRTSSSILPPSASNHE